MLRTRFERRAVLSGGESLGTSDAYRGGARYTPLTQEQEDAEHERRMDQMALNMDKLRLDIRTENRKFFVQATAALAVAIGGTVAAMTYVRPNPPPAFVAPPPQIIYLVPGPPPAK